MDTAFNVSQTNPSQEQFTKEIYIRTGHTLSIVLLLTNGQRPETIEHITTDDVYSINPNLFGGGLFTMFVEKYKAEKSGKTSNDKRLGMCATVYKLLLHFTAMRSVITLPENSEGHTKRRLFCDFNGNVFTSLKSTKSFADLGLPPTLTFVKQRAQVSTFYRQNPATTHIDPAVLLNHGRAMQSGPYNVKGTEDFDRANIQLRQHIPTSTIVTPDDEQIQASLANNLDVLRGQLALDRSDCLGQRNR